MTHEIAKLLLEKADTALARTDAIKAALDLGMPLSQIEEYLDWLEMVRTTCRQTGDLDRPCRGGSANGQP